MADNLGYPCVEGELGIKTKNVHVMQANVTQANIATLTEAMFNRAGIEAGDLVYITFAGTNEQDLYKIPSPFGALLKYTPA